MLRDPRTVGGTAEAGRVDADVRLLWVGDLGYEVTSELLKSSFAQVRVKYGRMMTWADSSQWSKGQRWFRCSTVWINVWLNIHSMDFLWQHMYKDCKQCFFCWICERIIGESVEAVSHILYNQWIHQTTAWEKTSVLGNTASSSNV